MLKTLSFKKASLALLTHLLTCGNIWYHSAEVVFNDAVFKISDHSGWDRHNYIDSEETVRLYLFCLFRCVLASLQEHYDLECWKHHRLKGLHLLHSLICSLMGTSDIIVQGLFLMTPFSGFQIIVGETDIISLTQMRLSDYIFSVCIKILTQNLITIN